MPVSPVYDDEPIPLACTHTALSFWVPFDV